MSEPEPVIVLRADGVTAGYGGPPIVDDVSLTIHAGKITAVVGPNGAGKSTLLKALAGVLRTTGGEVLVRGQNVTNLAPEKLVKRGLAYVPQVSNVFPDLTVRENMEMGAYTRRRGVPERISELCELFPDLGAALRRRAGMLSGGQRRRHWRRYLRCRAEHPAHSSPRALGLHSRARAQPAGRSRTGPPA